jgi:hypothetical protein
MPGRVLAPAGADSQAASAPKSIQSAALAAPQPYDRRAPTAASSQHKDVNLPAHGNLQNLLSITPLTDNESKCAYCGSDSSTIAKKTMKSQHHSTPKKGVSFIPPQLDSQAATSTQTAKDSPSSLAFQDTRTLFSMMNYLPWVVIPFCTNCEDAELYLHGKNLWALITISIATLLTFIGGILAIPAFIILPGGLIALVLALGTAIVHGICARIQGPMIVHSKLTPETKALASKFAHERWIFVNGCCVANVGLQMNCDRLSRTFNRPVLGIHNRTYGIVGDLTECVIQRAFNYNTGDSRYAYDHVKAALADPSVKKVVLVGHSQGGIILSMIVDHLYADLPSENIAKLEIYTFGSAASHFNNPLHALRPMTPPRTVQRAKTFSFGESSPYEPQRVIKHIEHYCNSFDMVTRWGVLHSVKDLTDNRFAGRIFVHMNASGHMFNQHYLSTMFPIEGDALFQKEHAFLDQEVDVDEGTADKREATAELKLGIRRRESKLDQLEMGDGQDVELRALEEQSRREERGKLNIVGGSEEGSNGVGGGQKSTVRELSRLWRYVGGGDPDTDLSPLLETRNVWKGH